MGKNKKIAIVHDWFDIYGGSENVVYTLLEIFPESDLYSLLITSKAQKYIQSKFPNVKIHTSFFQNLRFLLKFGFNLSIIKIISWIYWEKLDMSKYDLIISSSHSFGSKAVGKKRKKESLHISYIHTPPKYLYQETSENNWFKKTFLVKLLKKIDLLGSARPDILIANSKNVQNRIKKYYKRDSIVVYPPVEIKINKFPKKNYYLWFSRMTPQKGIELAVKTAVKNNIKLVVAGGGLLERKMKKISNGKIKFKGVVNEKEKNKLLSEAKALIFTAIDEDFGIVPIEAMRQGTPVIAFNSGGIKETVINNKTGILFDKYNQESLYKAVKKMEYIKLNRQKIKKWSQKFSKKEFTKQIKKIISQNL